MKAAFFDKLIERLDMLDPKSVQAPFLRLTREKGLLEAIFNTIQEAIIVVDSQGLIQYANTSAAHLLGFDPDASAHLPLGRFLREIEWDRILALDETEWSKLMSREIEVTYPRHRFLRFYVIPLMLADNRDRGAAVILRDITSDRERELSRLQSDQVNTLTLLTAGVAHEIGNPLNSLHIHLQLMERELAGLPPAARDALGELVRVSRQEVERLHATITQFLRAVRPTQPQLEPTRIEDLLRDTLAFMKHEIANRDVVVDIRAAEPTPEISADRNQVKQAFFNVIKNALQAMARGGLLTITVFADDQHVGVSFADSGVGIPPEDISRLFEPFRSTKPAGTGLGLMIVQRIVQDHGGQIDIQSRPQAGTTVTLRLPLDVRRVRLLQAPAPLPARTPEAET